MLLPRTLAAVLLTCAAVHAAEVPASPLPRSSPEKEGVDPAALLSFLEGAEEKVDALHSFILLRHGRVVAEGWWAPYTPDERHQLFSLSKSFTATAVGIAIHEGRLTLDDTVVSFFPDKVPANPSENLKAMRVRDLLTMSTGHHDEAISGFPFGANEDLVAKFLSLPVAHKPGTSFVYNTPATFMLSAIVQKLSGEPLVEYLKPRLFQPLGITDPVWDASVSGISFGGFGLSLRTDELARFGQLLLERGEWEGKQLVPAEWIDLATSRQVSNGSNPHSDWEQGYGFQFWRCRNGFYRGDGAHGQFCIVMPQYDAVLAITSGTRDMGSVMALAWDRLVPGLKEAPVGHNEEAARRLAAKLSNLQLRAPSGAATPADTLPTRAFRIPPTPLGLETLKLLPRETGEQTTLLAVRAFGHDQLFRIGHGEWARGELRIADKKEPVAALGAWIAPDTLKFVIYGCRTPFGTTYTLKFSEQQLLLEGEANIGPEPRTFSVTAVAAD